MGQMSAGFAGKSNQVGRNRRLRVSPPGEKSAPKQKRRSNGASGGGPAEQGQAPQNADGHDVYHALAWSASLGGGAFHSAGAYAGKAKPGQVTTATSYTGGPLPTVARPIAYT